VSFLEGARTLAELADENGPTGNAIAAIAVHAAIAWSDAVSIAYAGMKSTDGDHMRAADPLHDALGARMDAQALRWVLQKKDTVAYGGDYYRVSEALALLERAEEFCALGGGCVRASAAELTCGARVSRRRRQLFPSLDGNCLIAYR